MPAASTKLHRHTELAVQLEQGRTKRMANAVPHEEGGVFASYHVRAHLLFCSTLHWLLAEGSMQGRSIVTILFPNLIEQTLLTRGLTVSYRVMQPRHDVQARSISFGKPQPVLLAGGIITS